MTSNLHTKREMGHHKAVGIATRYGLDGPRIEPSWGGRARFSTPALEPTQLLAKWITGVFSGVKRPGRGFNHPLSSMVEVKERTDLCLYSHSVLSSRSGVNFTSILPQLIGTNLGIFITVVTEERSKSLLRVSKISPPISPTEAILCRIPPWRWAKKAEICRSNTVWLYTVVS